MRLHIGQRLAGTGPALQPGGYVVTAVVAETPWYGLYAGKRIFYNFDFTNKRLRETDEAEWLDVYLRTVRYQPGEDAEHGRLRRELARAEVRRILSNRFSNLWPEPIDLLEIADGRQTPPGALDMDHGAPADDREPIVIFARPSGESLGAWQRKVVPLASVLTVLAELLEFLRQAHAEGLLLQGLGPGAILVDPSDRIHYLGADMVLDQRSDAARQWREVFAPARLPRGFAAPELYDDGAEPDARSDLYSWGALAYFLFTGHSPEKITAEQGKDWANFQVQHFERLSKSLAGIPVTHCRNWAEQLGVGDQALLKRWPTNVVEVFRFLLHHERQRRPGSVEELLSWFEAPPPPPVNALLAVMVGPGEARVCVDLEGLGDDFDLVIRRGVSEPPRTPQEGTLLEQGPAAAVIADPAVPLTPAPVYYTAFLRRATSNGPIYSTGIPGELLTATPAALRLFAESEARSGEDPSELESALPPRLALCLRALEPVQFAEVLLASAQPRVRAWAIEQLRDTLSAKELAATPAEELDPAERVLWHALPDPVLALRVQTVRALLARRHSPSDDLALSFARAIIKGDLDQAEQAVQVLRDAGIKAEQSKWVLDFLEGERPLTCPECQAQLQRRDRLNHLHHVHGYVEVGGSWLPRPTALERLWRRVLEDGDVPAHERLLEVLVGLEDTYVALLEQELARRETAAPANGNNVAIRLKALEPYEKSLRAPRMQPRLPEFLRSRSPLVRALGQNACLAVLAGNLRGLRMQPRELRADLNRLLPNLLEECIVLCRQLPGAGIDAEAAAGCLRLLEGDRLTVCSECAAPVRIADLETHLRRAHSIFQFRGRRGNFRQTRSRVLDAALGPPADASAWKVLEDLALDQHGHDADKCVTNWVCHRLLQYRRKRQVGATAAAAGFLASEVWGLRLLPWLARRWKQPALQVLARALALDIVCRMKPPIAPEVIARVRPLLGVRELPRLFRSRAVEALLKTTGPSGEQALDVLSIYVSQSGKLRAIDKLRRLEKRVGQSPSIDVLCARLEDQVRMDCPRCGVQLRRSDMVRHLWDEHRLLLEGRRVREPWRVLDDWVVDYQLEKDPAVLARCRDLARKLEGGEGLLRLEQLLLRHGAEDADLLHNLEEKARERDCGLCPHCFHLQPMPQSMPPAYLAVSDSVMAGAGFRLELSEIGLIPSLTIEGPGGLKSVAREPGGNLTRWGGLVLLGGSLAILLLAASLWLLGSRVPGALLLAINLGLDLILAGVVYYLWPGPRPARDRLLNAAWNRLVPDLLERKWSGEEVRFLGSLCRSSAGAGDPRPRSTSLSTCQAALETWTVQRPEAVPALAALWRLAAEDQHETGNDPAPLLVEQTARSLQGKLPLAYAEVLLEGLPPASLKERHHRAWPRGAVRRLQVLLAEAAFVAGLETADFAELARLSPVLGGALGSDDLDRLAQLRQVWSMRGGKEWKHLGELTTVFELAREPVEGALALQAQADLLLVDRHSGLIAGSEGVWLKEVCFTTEPANIEVASRRIINEDGFDLVVGSQRFWFAKSPTDLARRLENWFRFYFREFLPRVQGKTQGPVSAVGRRLLSRNTISCSGCRREFLPCMGKVGLSVEATAE